MIWKVLSAVLVVTVLTIAIPAVRHLREVPPPPPPVVRVQLAVPADLRIGAGAEPLDAAISPDQSLVALVATRNGETAIWLQSLASGEMRALAGTAGASFPAWAADGRSLVFFAGGKLNRVVLETGAIVALADVSMPAGAACTADGAVLFAGDASGVVRRLANGTIADVTALTPGDRAHLFPFVDPSGRLLYVAVQQSGVRVVRMVADGVSSDLTETSGHAELRGTLLVHVRDQVLLAQHVNDTGTRLIGRSTPLATGVGHSDRGRAYFTTSSRVAIWARSVARDSELAWFGPNGQKRETVTEPGDYWQVRLSPDGRNAALTSLDPLLRTLDVNVVPLAAPGNARRLSLAIGPDTDPVWSPTGSTVLYRSAQSGPGAIFERPGPASARAEELVLRKAVDLTPSDWRGRQVLFHAADGSGTRNVFVLDRMSGQDRPVTQSGFNSWNGRWSIDGRWIAYSSDESGQAEVYVQGWPGGAPRVRATFGGGQRPQWGPDGSLYFLRGERLMRTSLSSSTPPVVATPQPVLSASGLRDFAVAAGGILAITAAAGEAVADAQMILDWQTGVPPPTPPIIR
jgi:Tol biopolymer transport system component